MKKSTISKKAVKPSIVKAVENVVKKAEPVNVLADPITEKPEVKSTEEAKTAEEPKASKAVKAVKSAAKTAKTTASKAAKTTASKAAKTTKSTVKAAEAAKAVFVEIDELKVNTEELVKRAEEEFKKQYPDTEIKDIKVYLNTNEKIAYYVVNETAEESFKIYL